MLAAQALSPKAHVLSEDVMMTQINTDPKASHAGGWILPKQLLMEDKPQGAACSPPQLPINSSQQLYFPST